MEKEVSNGMLQYEVAKGLAGGGPGAPAPFVAACHLYSNAAADFQKGIAAHGGDHGRHSQLHRYRTTDPD
jgi:hypothetical protein